jgi:Cft2 family RNA processing exonuclease
MKIHFLGGADEIGASCALLEAGGRRVLVDAGVRMGSSRRDRLPDLARATDLGGIDEVLVTHAHLDHSGALPLVHGAFPRARVWMTEPTLALLRILLLDAIKIMELKSDREDEIPLYPLPAVEALLGRAGAVPWLRPVELCGGELRATFFPAGHVLGASAVGIETPEGSVLFTGDLSVTDQLTVPGMPRPRFRPDVVVCESTYGARMHASRRAEEQRLAGTVTDVLHQGGKVLIPAFALGRAQEVLLVLRRALARDDAPAAARVYADGMVKAVCAIYGAFPDYLTPVLRRRAATERGPFYTADGRIQPVATPEQREAILAGEACVVVASSGMLSGGPSTRYAAALAGSEDALIAITGYQDEEAPGRRLQEAAAGGSSELHVDGQRLPVRCRVETYGLSAHADASELAGLVSSLRPGDAALVHGDPEAREALARRLMESGVARVHLPGTGECVDFSPRPVQRSGARTRGVGEGRELDGDGLALLHRALWGSQQRGRTFSAAELAERWYGSGNVPVDLGPLEALLSAQRRWFLPDARRPFLYRCVDPEASVAPAPAAGEPRDAAGRLEQNAALALVERELGPESGLYRKGADRERWTLRLCFHFPLVAEERHRETLAAVAEASGWAVEVHPETHLAALEQRLLSLLGPEIAPSRAPSVRTDTRIVTVKVAALPDDAVTARVQQALEQETGFGLRFELGGAATPTPRAIYDEAGRMEINAALAEVDRVFAGLPHRPHKKSKKRDAGGELIELAFISPEVGARYGAALEDLSYRTSWRIRVADRVDQQAVLRLVRELIPEGWQLSKGPGLDVAGRKVRLKLLAPPDEAERAAVSRKLREGAGFELD